MQLALEAEAGAQQGLAPSRRPLRESSPVRRIPVIAAAALPIDGGAASCPRSTTARRRPRRPCHPRQGVRQRRRCGTGAPRRSGLRRCRSATAPRRDGVRRRRRRAAAAQRRHALVGGPGEWNTPGARRCSPRSAAVARRRYVAADGGARADGPFTQSYLPLGDSGSPSSTATSARLSARAASRRRRGDRALSGRQRALHARGDCERIPPA